MLRNYLKIAWRNLLKTKGFSAINIGGLAIGMTVAMLIGLWIQYETSFDSFHKNEDRIARVQKHDMFNGQKNTSYAMPLPLYDELKNNYPEVKRASRVSWYRSKSLMVDDARIEKKGIYVDPDFLHMFSFPLVKGDVNTALNDPNSILLTESLASILFGKEDPMGKTIRLNNQYDVHVSGILKDVPKNSSLKFDFLAPYKFEIQTIPFLQSNLTNWSNNMLMTMVELKEGVSMEALSDKIGPLNVEKGDGIKNQILFLYPLSKWHLYNEFENWKNVGGRIEYVRLFGIIGIFVLLIACINFMNLSTARSEKRANEVGIRKVVGSRRRQLVFQFLSESMLTSFLAFLLAIGLVYILLPFLGELGFENIRFDLGNVSLMALILPICILAGLISGSYPSLYLSSFLPASILKGGLKQGKAPVTFRRILVITQFSISIVLIIGTIIVFQQINYAKDRPLGYDPDNLITINGSKDLTENYEVLKEELLNTSYIESVARASSPLTAIYSVWNDFSWDGKDPDEDIALDVVMAGWDYPETVGITLKDGRSFSRKFSTDSDAVMLNEAALKVIGYKDPIGRTMKSGDRQITIIGIIKDVLIVDPFKPIAPTVILFNADAANNIFLRLREKADLRQALAAIKPIFEKHNPSFPFEYSFVDEAFDKKFTTENQVGKLAGLFAILAIFISCLGLFGMASFMAEQRTKEIGIRKVLGASISALWQMLSKDFVVLVIVACVIASPIAYYFMSHWLQNYEYRIEISWWIFVIAGLGALFITLVTVSFQSIKAALTNPVKSLRTE